MRKILLENALESWSIAIKYCKNIKNGLATLHYQKTFISSLHNAVELFMKQIMIDYNDHNVAKMFNVKDENEAQIQLEYYQSDNLNEFFEKLSEDSRSKFRSIEYNKIIYMGTLLDKLRPEIIEKNSIKDELKQLQKLRNNETHFYITSKGYLSETDFMLLHNLMIVIDKALHEYNLLPYFGRVTKFRKYAHLSFEEQRLTNFSYKMAIRESPISENIKKVLSGVTFNFYEDAFGLAECYFEKIKNSGCNTSYSFDDIYAAIKMLKKYNFIKFNEEIIQDEIILDDGEIIPPQCIYHIDVII